MAVALAMRESGAANDLVERLAGDPRLGLSRDELDALVSEPLELSGSARSQVARLAARVGELAAAQPEAAAYRPGAVL